MAACRRSSSFSSKKGRFGADFGAIVDGILLGFGDLVGGGGTCFGAIVDGVWFALGESTG